jgi:hypothetical protein
MGANLFISNFNNIMNRYTSRVIKILAFIFLIASIDQVVGLILRKLYFHQRTGENYAMTYVYKNCTADILIFGSSRAQHHYDTRILSDRLKMSCYNAGIDGGHSILLPYAQIKVITKRYSPKIIILEFDPDNIVRYAGDYDRLSVLLPYYKEYPELRPLILLRGPYEREKLLSAIYPFNSNIINIIRYNTNTHAARRKDFEGYIQLESSMNIGMLKKEPGIETQSVLDTNMINALKNIISLCKEKNITLLIINSPIYHTVSGGKTFTTLAAKLSLEIIHHEKVNYHDFSFDSTFAGHMEWFKDFGHLNDNGAKIFTNLVIDSVMLQLERNSANKLK